MHRRRRRRVRYGLSTAHWSITQQSTDLTSPRSFHKFSGSRRLEEIQFSIHNRDIFTLFFTFRNNHCIRLRNIVNKNKIMQRQVTMNSRSNDINTILLLAKMFSLKNHYYTIAWLFVRYAHLRFRRLSNKKSKIRALPKKIIEVFAKKIEKRDVNYLDETTCAFGKFTKNTLSSEWFYICSKITHRKYKILVVPYDDCEDEKIFVSETTLRNLEKALRHELDNDSFFVMPADEEIIPLATEASVSMISNPYDCSNDFVDCLCETYFAAPKYLRVNDLFGIEPKDYAADFFYSTANANLERVYFKVNYLRVKRGDNMENMSRGCYVAKGETTLVQATHVCDYLPRETLELVGRNVEFSRRIERCCIENCPPFLKIPLRDLQACIKPFLREDIKMKIQPAFLVKGEPGSGKFKLIQTLAKRNGLNLLNIDFADVQSPSAAQTEAKLRNVLQNARNSVPCILKLSNIQIFGKNSEGQKDERIITAFAAELKNLNEKISKYPLIVIATLENDEIDGDIARLFIENICIEHPNQLQKAETLSWVLESKGLTHDADLTKVAGSVSDFRFADLESLVMQAAKIAYQLSSTEKISNPVVLMNSNFVEACERMQSTFSDRIGAPRIPKVYWDDIGGLANLKHEIKRRIELPMFETMGLGKSGILLYGPPGTGKTLLAKAVATECQLHFMSIKGPELLNMYVGQSEKNIRQVFERARAAAPCVIFFDELDSLAPNRGRSGDSGGVMDRVVSQLLAEMDGLQSSGNIFIIGATNRPDLIDPALLRPGRFDKMLYVGIYSDRESQLSVLRAVTRRFAMKNNGEELEGLVGKLPVNLTGADLYAVCSDAWLLAVRRHIAAIECEKINKTCETLDNKILNSVVVELQDFVEAARNLIPSVSSDELARYERLRMELSPSK